MEVPQTLDSSDILRRSAATQPVDRSPEHPAATADPSSDTVDDVLGDPTDVRRPLLFDPEPQQRMVVVRRRKRRRTRKATTGERFVNGLRVVMLGLVAVFLVLKITGQQGVLVRIKDHVTSAVRPVKAHLHAPDADMVALVLVGLVLIYTMPGVPAKINRLLGIGNDRRRK